MDKILYINLRPLVFTRKWLESINFDDITGLLIFVIKNVSFIMKNKIFAPKFS